MGYQAIFLCRYTSCNAQVRVIISYNLKYLLFIYGKNIQKLFQIFKNTQIILSITHPPTYLYGSLKINTWGPALCPSG